MPSRAMLHTGRELFSLQGAGESIPQDHTLLGETLRDAGYQTFGTGKWHNGPESFARSFTDGAEIFFGGMDDHWNVPACDFDPTGRYDNRKPWVDNPKGSGERLERHVDHVHLGVHSTDLFAQSTRDFLDRHDPDHPFLAYVSFMAPHDPRTMPEQYLRMYDPAEIELPGNFQSEHPIDTGALRIRDELLAVFPRDPDEIRRHIAEYYAMITHLDDAIGQILQRLEERGELENTLIVFAGDNGLALGQHGLLGKQNLYEHSTRVPLIFAGPGIPQGHQAHELVYLLDIYPTLCDLLGLDIPDSVQGRSLAPLLAPKKSGGTPREFLYLAYCDSIRGLTTGRHKLIEYACGETQLFDLQTDPTETRNLADDPALTRQLHQMRRQLTTSAQSSNDHQHPHGAKFWSNRPDLAAFPEKTPGDDTRLP
jgi:arylsulfatase A-like enzyme